MGLDNEFIKTAKKIRKKLEGIKEDLISDKVSKYNSEIIIDQCLICNNPTEEVHHIKEQELADEDNMIEYHYPVSQYQLMT